MDILQAMRVLVSVIEVGMRYLERCRLILGEVEDANAHVGGAHLKR